MRKRYQKQSLVILTLLLLTFNLFSQITVDLKAFLEGPFDPSSNMMVPELNNAGTLPLVQPFNQYPWFYEGNEQVASIPNSDVIDWVLVELRESGNDISNVYGNYRVANQAGFLLRDGSIVAIDGAGAMQFNITVTEKLYAVVYHRNHLPVISSAELTGISGTYIWDFSSGQGQAYGGSDAQKELSPGIWGMIAGDGSYDGIVDQTDKNIIWTNQAGTKGYLDGDFSMNSQVDNTDKNEYWVPNEGKMDQVPGTWECGDPIYDARDGKTYATIAVNTQCWMAENLNIGTMISGLQNMSDNGIIEKYCYDNLEENCDTSGGLYQWDEIMHYTTLSGTQGICPDGWHLPTESEWCTLELEVDYGWLICTSVGWRGLDAGGHLKDTTRWEVPNTGATNKYGFTAIPGGYRSTLLSNNFNGRNDYAYYWYSEESNATDSDIRYLAYHTAQINKNHSEKEYGFSVRCIWDFEAGNLPPYPPAGPDPDMGDTNVVINTSLSWFGADPNHEPLTYSIYLGTDAVPPLVQTNHPDTFYVPGYLHYDTTYFWRIVAYDPEGDSTSGPVWSFTTREQAPWICGDSIIDFRDGQVYYTAKIGSQCWLSENLNIGTQINGVQNMSDNDVLEKYCYGDDPLNCDTYGGLYQWDEVMDYDNTAGTQGICPDGWHVPTDEEWKAAEGQADSQYAYPDPEWNTTGWRGFDAGFNLKSSFGWSSNGNGSDSYHFSVLPAGRMNGTGGYVAIGIDTYLWSSSEFNSSEVWCRRYNYAYDESARYTNTHDLGFPVRCIWDQMVYNDPPDVPENPSPGNGATGTVNNDTLRWSCSDPDGDTLVYNIYFGDLPNPPLVYQAYGDTNFYPGVLTFSTEYFWKVVAYDIYGDSAVGPVWSFTTMDEPVFNCGDDLIDYRDNQTYATVDINGQCWMAENLNIGTMIPGSQNMGDDGNIDKYCYQDDVTHCDNYAGLYLWGEVMNYTTVEGSQGICPDGWHIPTVEEFKLLEGAVDTQYGYPDPEWDNLGWRGFDAGLKLKSTSGWYNNGNGTNDSGFNAYPAGYRNNSGNFSGMTYTSNLWTSSEYFTNYININSLSNSQDDSGLFVYTVDYGLSVRCIRNSGNMKK